MLFSLPINRRRWVLLANPLFLVFIMTACLILRTVDEPLAGPVFRRWDCLLPAVVFLGQRRKLWEGLALVFIFSHVYALASSAPLGLYLVYYLFLFFAARFMTYLLYASEGLTIVVLLLALSFAGEWLHVFLRLLFGVPLQMRLHILRLKRTSDTFTGEHIDPP